jgi:hypothetical protein
MPTNTNSKSVEELRDELSTLFAIFCGRTMVLALEIQQAANKASGSNAEQLRLLYGQSVAAYNYISPFSESTVGLKPANASELH